MEVYKVLPVTEEDGGGANDDVNSFYVDEKEVKVEVMRARGAGGQVRCEEDVDKITSLTDLFLACEQNRICRSIDAHPNRNKRLHAGQPKSTHGAHTYKKAS